MNNHDCIDAGREGCPCALAAQKGCLVCGKLCGETCEQCSWQGSCIAVLYEQNGRRPAAARKTVRMPVVQIRDYCDSLKVFVLEADRGFCQKAQTAGAYVFVRGEDDPSWYDMPVSVLKAEPEKGLIHLGICRCGPKSGRIFQSKEGLLVRGIYHHGLSGLEDLSEKAEMALIYAKGIAAAPLRNLLDGGRRYTKWLRNMRIFIDLEKVGFDFFMDYFADVPVDSVEVRDFNRMDFFDPERKILQQKDHINVLALTSPYFADQIQEICRRKIVRPIEGNFCCGEGICGACTCVDENGKTVRRCKLKD